jgi:hypothetical protein
MLKSPQKASPLSQNRFHAQGIDTLLAHQVEELRFRSSLRATQYVPSLQAL